MKKAWDGSFSKRPAPRYDCSIVKLYQRSVYVNTERGEQVCYHCRAGAGQSSAGTWVQDVASDAGILPRVGTLLTPTAVPGNRKVRTAWRQDIRWKRLTTWLIFESLWVSLS
jgi:hypothetical protein